MLLALSVTWGAARAEATDNSYIGKVTQLRDTFKPNEALKLIEEARKSNSQTKEQLVTLDLLEGVLLYETTNQPDKAEPSFLRALTASPEARLSFEVAPKIDRLLEEVRARVKKSPPPPRADPPPPVATVGEDKDVSAARPEPDGGGHGLVAYRVPLALVGGGLAAAGVFSWVQAKSTERRLRAGDESIATRTQFDAAVSRGKTYETVGWILVGAGAATTVGSLLLLRPSRATPSVSAVPTPGGAHVALVWNTP